MTLLSAPPFVFWLCHRHYSVLVFSTGRNYSHNGRISLDKSLSANKQKGVTRATKLCATLKDGLSPPWRSWVLTCVHCSCPSYSIQPKPGWPRRSFALFLVQVDSTTKGAEAPVDTLKFHDGTRTLANLLPALTILVISHLPLEALAWVWTVDGSRTR